MLHFVIPEKVAVTVKPGFALKVLPNPEFINYLHQYLQIHVIWFRGMILKRLFPDK